MNLGKSIKELRKEKGLSQDEMAEKTGITQSAISHIESGKKRPSENSMKKICKVLGISEALLHIHAVERADIQPKKRALFDQLFPVIKDLIHQVAK